MLYGDDVLVGPARDPAGVGGARPGDIAAALRLVAGAGRAGRSDFIAGGIGQGEAPLWQAAKVTRGEQPVPVGERWYHYGASDPAAVVRSAAACAYPSKACYALVDRGVLRQLQAAGRRAACASSSPATRAARPAPTPRSHTPCAHTRRSGRAARRARCSRC